MRLFPRIGARWIVLLACTGTLLLCVALFGLAAVFLRVELAVGGSGVQVSVIWTIIALTIAAGGPLWLLVDRQLTAYLYDRRNLPARPEFYDLKSQDRPIHGDEIAGKPLRDLSYVVFDTETTGLRPGGGDEIISIAAVRLQNGDIDEAGAFSRLVNPGRPIPPGSTKFHGITDDMVKNENPITDVLKAFRDYVGDAILVAHNADFDMAFLKLKEQESGVEIANVVLDTLLISVFVDYAARNHSLDSVAERLAVEVEGRHTALGDSIATAKIFSKQLESP